MHLDWVGLFGALGIWTTGIGALIGWLHKQAKAGRADLTRSISDLSSRMDAAHLAITNRMTKEHDAVRLQISDIVETTNQNYVPRREFDIALRGVESSITNARKDIGAVGESVNKIHERVDELFGKVEFRRAPR